MEKKLNTDQPKVKILTKEEKEEISKCCKKIMLNLLDTIEIANKLECEALHNILLTVFHLLNQNAQTELNEIEEICRKQYMKFYPSHLSECVIH